jgi:hypothetical protein
MNVELRTDCYLPVEYHFRHGAERESSIRPPSSASGDGEQHVAPDNPLRGLGLRNIRRCQEKNGDQSDYQESAFCHKSSAECWFGRLQSEGLVLFQKDYFSLSNERAMTMR